MLGWLSDTASLQKSINLLIIQWPCNSKVFSRISVILHALALADKEVPIYHKRFPLGCSLSLNGTKNSSKVPFFTTKKASVFHLTFVFAIVFAFLFQPKTTLLCLLTTQNTVALFIQHLCLHQNENRSRTGLGDVGRRWPTEEFVRNLLHSTDHHRILHCTRPDHDDMIPFNGSPICKAIWIGWNLATRTARKLKYRELLQSTKEYLRVTKI